MRFQDQTFLHEELDYRGSKFTMKGNCMMACYASYFEFDVSEVPQIQFLTGTLKPKYFWNDVLNLWLNQLGYEEYYYKADTDPYIKGFTDDYYFAFGTTNRNLGVMHQVIFKDGEMVHDPHPSKSGLVKIEGFITLDKLKTTNP